MEIHRAFVRTVRVALSRGLGYCADAPAALDRSIKASLSGVVRAKNRDG
jgi:hypothetical protein